MNLGAIAVFLAQAVDGSAAQDPQDWKEVLSWVLGLPVTLVAAAGTIYAIPKARRENRKLDLEILEKERALGLAKDSNDVAEVARIVAEPLFENRRGVDLILRFVLLSLLLQAWGLVINLLGSASASAQLGLNRAVEQDSSIAAIAGYVLIATLAALPNVVRALLFVGIGWPLLLDSAKVLRFELPNFFYAPGTRHALIAIAVVASLMQALVGAGMSLFWF